MNKPLFLKDLIIDMDMINTVQEKHFDSAKRTVFYNCGVELGISESTIEEVAREMQRMRVTIPIENGGFVPVSYIK